MKASQTPQDKHAHLRITSESVAGKDAKVILNGQDIGGHTRDIRISIPLRGPIVATIEIVIGKLELESDAFTTIAPYLAKKATNER